MFEVVFEVHPKSEQWDAYLEHARLLKPELEQIEGFIDNVRYRSLTRDGWLVSLSTWRDEKSVIRWRTKAVHHGIQEKGRFDVFLDYRLRVGEITADTHPPAGQILRNQRLDATEVGEAKQLLLIEARRPGELAPDAAPEDVARSLGFAAADGVLAWDVFDAVLSPGDLVLIMSFRDEAAIAAFRSSAKEDAGTRLRTMRVIRDYGMHDRREAPQYYPDVVHAGAARAADAILSGSRA